jgi:SAM-dependent methyltransferase
MAGYDTEFYEMITKGARTSAGIILALLGPAPETVVDVGCGSGGWLETFEEQGSEVRGYDGAWAAWPRTTPLDMTSGPLDFGTADLALCLEVAEHLDAARAPFLVEALCACADRIVFSAAIPRQGGVGHVNEQWPDYWAKLFSACGFGLEEDFRTTIWADERIEPWYRQNLLVYAKGQPYVEPLRLVHPLVWEAKYPR